MAIPDFQSVMLPLLNEFDVKKNLTSKEAIQFSIKNFKLTEDEVAQLLPSKTQQVIKNRVYWALVYLSKAGLIKKVKRGHYEITNRAREVLDDQLEKITVKYLKKYPEFVEFQSISKGDSKSIENDQQSNGDPLEEFEKTYNELKGEVLSEILALVRGLDPEDFEKLCLHLMQEVGYGTSGIHTGRSGDHGKDGMILVDALGLDAILLQCKRYKEGACIGESAIRDFIGTLNIHRANKGIFVTASHFSATCQEIIRGVSFNIVLIDGEKLANLLFKHNVGVTEKAKYPIKEVDHDFFDSITEVFSKVA